MKEILINKEIGGWWGLQPDELSEALAEVQPGDDVKITIDSPGGDFYAMVPMFNAIRNLARKKENKIETYIIGMAASCASMLALAAKAGNPENKITVEDNSIYMIHNCWTFTVGDHREFEDEAVQLLRVDELQRDIYTRATGKTRDEIKAWMDADTFFYGKEIVENGFADVLVDEVEQSEEDFTVAKSAKYADFKNKFGSMKLKFRREAENSAKCHASAIAACIKIMESMPVEKPAENINAAVAANKETEVMTLEELKAQFPDVYAAACKEGADAERSRIQAHLKMAGDSGDIKAALPFIESGAKCSEDSVVAAYHETFCKTLKEKEAAEVEASAKKLAALREAENPDAIQTPEQETEEDAELKAFNKELGIRG